MAFLVPIFQKQVGDCHEITFCKHLGTRVGAGAGTSADTGTYTKVKICFPRKLPPAKRDKLVFGKNICLSNNCHCKTPQPGKLYHQLFDGHKKSSFPTVFYHF